jgi:hypothetical protein
VNRLLPGYYQHCSPLQLATTPPGPWRSSVPDPVSAVGLVGKKADDDEG